MTHLKQRIHLSPTTNNVPCLSISRFKTVDLGWIKILNWFWKVQFCFSVIHCIVSFTLNSLAFILLKLRCNRNSDRSFLPYGASEWNRLLKMKKCRPALVSFQLLLTGRQIWMQAFVVIWKKRAGFMQTQWLKKTSIHHEREVCCFIGRLGYEILLKYIFIWRMEYLHGLIIHDTINNMHLEYWYHTDFKKIQRQKLVLGGIR